MQELKPDLVTFGTAIAACGSDWQSAIELLSQMLASGNKASSIIVASLRTAQSKIRNAANHGHATCGALRLPSFQQNQLVSGIRWQRQVSGWLVAVEVGTGDYVKSPGLLRG